MEKQVDISGSTVIIAIPCYDGKISIEIMKAMLETKTELQKYGSTAAFYFKPGCSLLDKARNEILMGFLQGNGTHLLCVDADVVWEPSDAIQLLAWCKTKENKIFVGPYPVKNPDKRDFRYPLTLNDDKYVVTDEDGLVEVDSAPAGFMMLSREVLEKMIEALPEESYYKDFQGEFKDQDVPCLFESKVVDNVYVGEDVLFCRRAKEAGVTVWLDPNITLSHYGEYPYRHNFTEWAKETYQLGEN